MDVYTKLINLLAVVFILETEGSRRDGNLCPPGQFTCGNDTRCLPQHQWCDGVQNCPDGQDEWPVYCEPFDEEIEKLIGSSHRNATYNIMDPHTCELQTYPKNCTCRLQTSLLCHNLGFLRVPTIDPKVSLLSLSFNQIKILQGGTFGNMSKLSELYMNNNLLRSIEKEAFKGMIGMIELTLNHNMLVKFEKHTFSHLENLKYLSCSACTIVELELGCFAHLTEIKVLDLTDNFIEVIPRNLFVKNRALNTLLLGGNPLSAIALEVFWPLHNLENLNLRDCQFKNISVSHLLPLQKLKETTFAYFQQCQYVPHVRKCLPKSDGLSTVGDLLGDPVLRICVWFVAIVTLLGNVLVLVGRLFLKEGNKAHMLTIGNLCVADFLMGVYLVVIACYDIKYRGEYNAHALTWTSGWRCQITGALAMVSAEVSITILACISVERYLVITRPFQFTKIERRHAVITLSVVWIFCLTLSVLPILTIEPKYIFYGNNGVCFPLHIQNPFMSGWQWSAFVFLGFNVVAIGVTVICYVAMFQEIRKSRTWGHMPKANDAVIAKRFFWIIAAGIMCSTPIIICKFLAYGGMTLPDTVHAWLSVLIIPVNSALNPLLYTLTTLEFRKTVSRLLTHVDSMRIAVRSRTTFPSVFKRRNRKRKRSDGSPLSNSSGQFKELFSSFRSRWPSERYFMEAQVTAASRETDVTRA